MYENIIIWAILTLVPLIPTFVTHRFLKSSASYNSMNQGIKLGGAVAAYFILVTTAFFTYNNMTSDPLHATREALVGEWECIAYVTSDESRFDPDSRIQSTMNIHVNGSRKISLTGHMEKYDVYWQAEEVIVTDRKLIYIFNIPINDATGITWLGFTRGNDGDIVTLFGSWVVTGDEGRGTISCLRKRSS